MSTLTTFTWITIFALGAMMVNSIGILFVYKNRAKAEKIKGPLMCFAAGVLISSPLLMAFPEAIEKNPHSGLTALAGFIFMFIINKIIRHKTNQEEIAFGVTALVGIGIHSFIDGIMYSVTFSASIVIGILAGIGLVFHEFAEGVITFTALMEGGLSNKRAVFYAFLVAAATTPLGAFIAYSFVNKLEEPVLGLALGSVAGVLIYLSAAHLLPAARNHDQRHSYFAFMLGVLLAVLVMLSKNSY